MNSATKMKENRIKVIIKMSFFFFWKDRWLSKCWKEYFLKLVKNFSLLIKEDMKIHNN